MKMVVTLKSGVQIKTDVEEYTTKRSPLFGELRGLEWVTTDHPGSVLSWVDPSEVAAIHSEYEPGEDGGAHESVDEPAA